jgi:hypothetical protein
LIAQREWRGTWVNRTKVLAHGQCWHTVTTPAFCDDSAAPKAFGAGSPVLKVAVCRRSEFSFEGAVTCRAVASRRLKDGGKPGVQYGLRAGALSVRRRFYSLTAIGFRSFFIVG